MAFVPDKFDFLKASGRVRNSAALVGELLKIHPRVDLIGGYLVPVKKYRGRMERVIPMMTRDFVGEYQTDRPEIWLGHTPEFPEACRKAAEDTVRELGFNKLNWNRLRLRDHYARRNGMLRPVRVREEEILTLAAQNS